MRLLHTQTYEFNDYLDPESTEYAILSHRWNTGGSEILYHEVKNPSSRQALMRSSRFDKIKMACATARHHDSPLEWIWVDSCCIDQTNNVELGEALNSMYTWYRLATVCLAYLFDVNLYAGTNDGAPHLRSTADASQYSEWFSRGWTLQELLAPRHMVFYDQKWVPIGTKEGLASDLRDATGIPEAYLTGGVDVQKASAAMKLSWACGRTTTKREDRVYSLLGLLRVPLSPLYGEGEKRAFARLQQEFCKQDRDESIFAWSFPSGHSAANPPPSGWKDDEWGLLAPSIECFRDAGDVTTVAEGRRIAERDSGGYVLTNQGILFPVPDKSFAEIMEGPRSWGLSRKAWAEGLKWHLETRLFDMLVKSMPHYLAEKQRLFNVSLNCWKPAPQHEGEMRVVTLEVRYKGALQLWRRCDCSKLGVGETEAPRGREKGIRYHGQTPKIVIEQPPATW